MSTDGPRQRRMIRASRHDPNTTQFAFVPRPPNPVPAITVSKNSISVDSDSENPLNRSHMSDDFESSENKTARQSGEAITDRSQIRAKTYNVTKNSNRRANWLASQGKGNSDTQNTPFRRDGNGTVPRGHQSLASKNEPGAESSEEEVLMDYLTPDTYVSQRPEEDDESNEVPKSVLPKSTSKPSKSQRGSGDKRTRKSSAERVAKAHRKDLSKIDSNIIMSEGDRLPTDRMKTFPESSSLMRKEDTFVVTDWRNIAGNLSPSEDLRRRKALALAKANARHVLKNWKERQFYHQANESHYNFQSRRDNPGSQHHQRAFIENVGTEVKNDRGEKIYFHWRENEGSARTNHSHSPRGPSALGKLYHYKKKRLKHKYSPVGATKSAPNKKDGREKHSSPRHGDKKRSKTSNSGLSDEEMDDDVTLTPRSVLNERQSTMCSSVMGKPRLSTRQAFVDNENADFMDSRADLRSGLVSKTDTVHENKPQNKDMKMIEEGNIDSDKENANVKVTHISGIVNGDMTLSSASPEATTLDAKSKIIPKITSLEAGSSKIAGKVPLKSMKISHAAKASEPVHEKPPVPSKQDSKLSSVSKPNISSVNGSNRALEKPEIDQKNAICDTLGSSNKVSGRDETNPGIKPSTQTSLTHSILKSGTQTNIDSELTSHANRNDGAQRTDKSTSQHTRGCETQLHDKNMEAKARPPNERKGQMFHKTRSDVNHEEARKSGPEDKTSHSTDNHIPLVTNGLQPLRQNSRPGIGNQSKPEQASNKTKVAGTQIYNKAVPDPSQIKSLNMKSNQRGENMRAGANVIAGAGNEQAQHEASSKPDVDSSDSVNKMKLSESPQRRVNDVKSMGFARAITKINEESDKDGQKTSVRTDPEKYGRNFERYNSKNVSVAHSVGKQYQPLLNNANRARDSNFKGGGINITKISPSSSMTKLAGPPSPPKYGNKSNDGVTLTKEGDKTNAKISPSSSLTKIADNKNFRIDSRRGLGNTRGNNSNNNISSNINNRDYNTNNNNNNNNNNTNNNSSSNNNKAQESPSRFAGNRLEPYTEIQHRKVRFRDPLQRNKVTTNFHKSTKTESRPKDHRSSQAPHPHRPHVGGAISNNHHRTGRYAVNKANRRGNCNKTYDSENQFDQTAEPEAQRSVTVSKQTDADSQFLKGTEPSQQQDARVAKTTEQNSRNITVAAGEAEKIHDALCATSSVVGSGTAGTLSVLHRNENDATHHGEETVNFQVDDSFSRKSDSVSAEINGSSNKETVDSRSVINVIENSDLQDQNRVREGTVITKTGGNLEVKEVSSESLKLKLANGIDECGSPPLSINRYKDTTSSFPSGESEQNGKAVIVEKRNEVFNDVPHTKLTTIQANEKSNAILKVKAETNKRGGQETNTGTGNGLDLNSVVSANYESKIQERRGNTNFDEEAVNGECRSINATGIIYDGIRSGAISMGDTSGSKGTVDYNNSVSNDECGDVTTKVTANTGNHRDKRELNHSDEFEKDEKRSKPSDNIGETIFKHGDNARTVIDQGYPLANEQQQREQKQLPSIANLQKEKDQERCESHQNDSSEHAQNKGKDKHSLSLHTQNIELGEVHNKSGISSKSHAEDLYEKHRNELTQKLLALQSQTFKNKYEKMADDDVDLRAAQDSSGTQNSKHGYSQTQKMDKKKNDVILQKPVLVRPKTAGQSGYPQYESEDLWSLNTGEEEDDHIVFIEKEQDFFKVFGYDEETAAILMATKVYPVTQIGDGGADKRNVNSERRNNFSSNDGDGSAVDDDAVANGNKINGSYDNKVNDNSLSTRNDQKKQALQKTNNSSKTVKTIGKHLNTEAHKDSSDGSHDYQNVYKAQDNIGLVSTNVKMTGDNPAGNAKIIAGDAPVYNRKKIEPTQRLAGGENLGGTGAIGATTKPAGFQQGLAPKPRGGQITVHKQPEIQGGGGAVKTMPQFQFTPAAPRPPPSPPPAAATLTMLSERLEGNNYQRVRRRIHSETDISSSNYDILHVHTSSDSSDTNFGNQTGSDVPSRDVGHVGNQRQKFISPRNNLANEKRTTANRLHYNYNRSTQVKKTDMNQTAPTVETRRPRYRDAPDARYFKPNDTLRPSQYRGVEPSSRQDPPLASFNPYTQAAGRIMSRFSDTENAINGKNSNNHSSGSDSSGMNTSYISNINNTQDVPTGKKVTGSPSRRMSHPVDSRTSHAQQDASFLATRPRKLKPIIHQPGARHPQEYASGLN